MNRAKIYHNSRDEINNDRDCLCNQAYYAILQYYNNQKNVWSITEELFGYDEVTDQCEECHRMIDAVYPRLNENLQTYSIPTTS